MSKTCARLPITCRQTAVIIGHSLGGFVVQKYLEFHVAPAGVLVASTPPQGAAAAVLRTAGVLLRKTAQHPWITAKAIMTGGSLPGFNKLVRVRTMFFSAHTPESWVARYAERLKTEQSGRPRSTWCCRSLPQHGSRQDARTRVGRRCPTNPYLALHSRPIAFGGYFKFSWVTSKGIQI